MKLKLNNKEGNKETQYLDVSVWSFLKCWLLSYFLWMGIVFSTVMLLVIILIQFS